MRGRARGFTLLELIVAITVMTIIVGLVFATFSSVTDTMAIARDNADRMMYRQALYRSLTTNLGSVYSDSACLRQEYQFYGESSDGQYGPADRLQFCTSLPMPGSGALPGILCSVNYEVVSGSDVDAAATGYPGDDPDRPGMALLITESATSYESGLEGAISGSDEMPVSQRAIPVASFKVQYYDGVSGEWVDSWDSIAEQRLPWAVSVKVNFPRSQDEISADGGADISENPDLDIMSTIYTGAGIEGAFMDMNRARVDDTFGGMDKGKNAK